MSKVFIVPCMDMMDGNVVKGVKFVDIKKAGDPVECAIAYEQQGADELAMLDITASVENRTTMLSWVKNVARHITIPFTVGGGINSVDAATAVINAGASKVCVGSAAVKRPEVLREISSQLGKERVLLALDAAKGTNCYEVYTGAGKINTGIDALAWARQAESLGAGGIVLTSVDTDGTKSGYDLDLTRLIAESLSIPVIASGGAGKLEHFLEAVTIGKAQGLLAASLFHYKEISVAELKAYLHENGVDVYV